MGASETERSQEALLVHLQQRLMGVVVVSWWNEVIQCAALDRKNSFYQLRTSHLVFGEKIQLKVKKDGGHK